MTTTALFGDLIIHGPPGVCSDITWSQKHACRSVSSLFRNHCGCYQNDILSDTSFHIWIYPQFHVWWFSQARFAFHVSCFIFREQHDEVLLDHILWHSRIMLSWIHDSWYCFLSLYVCSTYNYLFLISVQVCKTPFHLFLSHGSGLILYSQEFVVMVITLEKSCFIKRTFSWGWFGIYVFG